jgi:hypothetical protein
MDLAQALAERADLQKLIAAERGQLNETARYQEGEIPAEPAVDILARVERNLDRLARLIAAINHTNAVTVLPSGRTITQAIAHRDLLAALRKVLTEAADSAAGTGRRAYMFRTTRTELVAKTDLDVPGMRARADQVAKEYRAVDDELQRAGWATQLLELPAAVQPTQ